ncbi:tetratricopeptide repeat protein [Flavobacteriaceae bacterium LMO-SS05]
MICKTEAQTSVLRQADSLYAYGNFSKAITYYKNYDKTTEVYDKIARAYISIGNYDEALKNFEASLKVNPNDALLKYEYAKLLSRTKHFKDASIVFNELVYLDYRNPNYHYELGLALEQLGDSTAINRFWSAYDLDPTYQKTIVKIAKQFVEKKEYEAAEKYINKGLETYANNVELINLKAQNYYINEYYKNAIVWFEKLLQLGENSEFIHRKLSVSYANTYQFEKAIEQLKLVLKDNPEDSNTMYVIGTYYEELQDFENAEKFVKQSLVLKDVPLDQEYQFLGKVYNQQKNYAEAIKAFKRAEKENPENEFTQFLLVLTKDKYYADLDARIKLFEDFKSKYPKSMYFEFVEGRLNELKEEKFMKED